MILIHFSSFICFKNIAYFCVYQILCRDETPHKSERSSSSDGSDESSSSESSSSSEEYKEDIRFKSIQSDIDDIESSISQKPDILELNKLSTADIDTPPVYTSTSKMYTK